MDEQNVYIQWNYSALKRKEILQYTTRMNLEDITLRVLNHPQKDKYWGTSLVAQWLRIRLPVQGTWVQALVQEDPTCRRATKPMCHNY